MMKQPSHHRYALILIVLCVVLLIPLLATAQETPPLIPHPVEFYRACLVCHETGLAEAPQVPEGHDGYANEICQDCHLPSDGAIAPAPVAEGGLSGSIPHTLEGRENCLNCHTPSDGTVSTGEAPSVDAGPPVIPHTLIGRESCLACHETGVGGATQIPADHEGRPEEVCQACHPPSQVPPAAETVSTEPVPTPIPYVLPQGIDNCVECHATLEDEQVEITEHWQRSIHAERGVICADCHGGDPTASTIDGSMNPDAGYIGVPDKKDIPALCASCHSDVNLMRQYDLPTDQYAKYNESVHGLRLARGDTNVTTCFDCHGGHQILKANDPASTVYPANVPALCAGCHADAELMAPYGIPTNQYELYQDSVHGHALLDNHDFRAPNCATCHGTHGAAPPGFEEVANVCGSCHSATQDHYLKSAHASVTGGPECVNCHGRYDVSKPSEEMYVGSEARHCGSCHTPYSEAGLVAQALYDSITTAALSIEEAEANIEAAQRLGMLVTVEENQLRESNTSLITARAAQHTLDIENIDELTSEATALAEEASTGAEDAINESLFRRQAMVIAVILIALVIVALYLIKRQLDRQLELAEQEEEGTTF